MPSDPAKKHDAEMQWEKKAGDWLDKEEKKHEVRRAERGEARLRVLSNSISFSPVPNSFSLTPFLVSLAYARSSTHPTPTQAPM
jgi:hypothetical protein